MSKVKAILSSGQETELEIEEVTLLSTDEAREAPKRLLKNRDYWWLCSPGTSDIYAAFVFGDDGYVNDIGRDVRDAFGVRPALRVRNLGSFNLPIESTVSINGHEYYVIPGDMLLSKESIGNCAFREDWRATDANVYEKSDVKKYVDDWAVKQGFVGATDVKEVVKQAAHVIPVV